MLSVEFLETLYVVSAFLFQIILIIHFTIRNWRIDLAMQYGPIVYAFSIPAAVVSMILLTGGTSWSLWMGGLIYLTWSIYGYWVEYVRKIEWRDPIRWSVFGPYIFLYLSTVMFYWWPLALIYKPFWYIYAVLFIISTILNLTSHKKK
jgi:hypothetical protein